MVEYESTSFLVVWIIRLSTHNTGEDYERMGKHMHRLRARTEMERASKRVLSLTLQAITLEKSTRIEMGGSVKARKSSGLMH